MNFETIVGLAAIISAVVAIFSFRLLHKEDRRQEGALKGEFRREESCQSPEESNKISELTHRSLKSVPPNILFSTTLLRTPSLEEMGVPAPLSYIPFIRCHVGNGEWVNRGDPLVTYDLIYYRKETRPTFLLRLLLGDQRYTHTFVLKSPISGFVTDRVQITCRKYSVARLSAFFGMLDKDSVLPTMLVPKNEPAWNNYQLNDVNFQIRSSIIENWKKNLHNLGGGSGGYKRVRLKQAIEENSFWVNDVNYKGQMAESLKWLKSNFDTTNRQTFSWPTCEYSEYKTSYGDSLDEYIEEYRAKDIELRDKLVHLL